MTATRTSMLRRLTACFCISLIFLTSCGGTDTGNPNAQTSSSQPLAIINVTPAEVKAGAVITITGTGFGDSQGASVLTIGGSTANTITSWSDSAITAVVPQDAMTGTVRTTIPGKGSEETRLVVLWDNGNPQNVGIPPGIRVGPLRSQILADGSGGAIIVWNDYRDYDPLSATPKVYIYAQRLDSRGAIVWNVDGVVLSTANGTQYSPQLVSDGSGGAIVVYRSGMDADIYAQRVSADGKVLWASGEIPMRKRRDGRFAISEHVREKSSVIQIPVNFRARHLEESPFRSHE